MGISSCGRRIGTERFRERPTSSSPTGSKRRECSTTEASAEDREGGSDRVVEDSTPDLNIVKRLIGVPGDTLQMVHDTVIRNRQRLDEPYALHTALTPAPDSQYWGQIRALQLPQYIGKAPDRYRPTTHDWGPIVVPPQHYWVMGDNRDESYDSRFWGFLPRAHIRGKPLVIYMSVAMNPFRVRWNRLFRHPS